MGALVLEEGARTVAPQRIGIERSGLRCGHRHLHGLVARRRRGIGHGESGGGLPMSLSRSSDAQPATPIATEDNNAQRSSRTRFDIEHPLTRDTRATYSDSSVVELSTSCAVTGPPSRGPARDDGLHDVLVSVLTTLIVSPSARHPWPDRAASALCPALDRRSSRCHCGR